MPKTHRVVPPPRNPQDSTLRKVRAASKQLDDIRKRLFEIENALASLFALMGMLGRAMEAGPVKSRAIALQVVDRAKRRK